MLKHYFRLAIRSFKAGKLIFAGSLLSISLGAICISLLFSYVCNELSMDSFNKRKNDIYLMVNRASSAGEWTGLDARLFLNFRYKDYPELENILTLQKYRAGEFNIKVGQLSVSPEILIADTAFFDFFDYKLLVGDKNTVMFNPNAALVTQSFAKKYFININPIGQIITTKAGSVFTVKGIVEDPPSNSSITFDVILTVNAFGNEFSRNGMNFLLARGNFNKEEFENKIRNIGKGNPQFNESITGIIPIHEVYFSTGSKYRYVNIFSKEGDKKSIYIMNVIMIVILLVTVLNFSNLQIVNLNSTIKNIGINKICGAGSFELVKQKCIEILIIICLGSFIITAGYLLFLPFFNKLTDTIISPSFFQVLLLNITIITVTILFAMIYPVRSTFTIPISQSLKRQVFRGRQVIGRRIIIIVQFTFSIILIISSIVVIRQLNMMLKKEVGFSSENVVKVKMLNSLSFNSNSDFEEIETLLKEQAEDYNFIKNELQSSSTVTGFAQGSSPLDVYSMPWKLNHGTDDYINQNMLIVTPEYDRLLGLEMTEGRFFDNKKDKDRENKVVINESAKKAYNISNIESSSLLNSFWSDKDSPGYEIIGVIKDFNYEHLAVKPQPLIMLYFEDVENDFLIKLDEKNIQGGLAFLQKLFENANSGETFRYSFISDEIASLYSKEKLLSIIYALFTIVALVITCTGLFTIALYEIQNRNKEIGVRKVNGARISEILLLLNKDFVTCVLIGSVIAVPVSYYAMNRWLQHFAYKTNLSWWIFAVAILLALGIALLTVSWQSLKAAKRNPVEVLRYE